MANTEEKPNTKTRQIRQKDYIFIFAFFNKNNNRIQNQLNQN